MYFMLYSYNIKLFCGQMLLLSSNQQCQTMLLWYRWLGDRKGIWPVRQSLKGSLDALQGKA